MRLACSTFPFDGLSIDQTFSRLRDLRFRYADLVLSDDIRWGQVTPTEVLRDPLLIVEELESAAKRHGLGIIAFNITLDRKALAERGRFEAVCKLARALGVRIISLGAGRGDELIEFRRLRDFHSLAGDFGAVLAVETIYPSLFQEPAEAVRFVEGLRGVRLTLDTGHLLQQGIPMDRWTPLYRHVAHVHIRDAGPTIPRHQVPFGQGGLDLDTLLSGLRGAGYPGALSIEYLGSRLDNAVTFDSEAEISKVRSALEVAVPDLKTN